MSPKSIYFLLGILLGGVSGAFYLVWMVKAKKINPNYLRGYFNHLAILWVIVILVVGLASLVF
jgi:hypothetical protein